MKLEELAEKISLLHNDDEACSYFGVYRDGDIIVGAGTTTLREIKKVIKEWKVKNKIEDGL